MTSAKRSNFAPEIAAIAEYKPLAQYQLENMFGLFAPAGTPDAVIQQLNTAVTKAIKDPDLSKRLQDQGGEPAPMSVQQFRDFIQTESKQFQRIVDLAKITAEWQFETRSATKILFSVFGTTFFKPSSKQQLTL